MSEKKYYPGFDILRVILSLWIVLYHYFGVFGQTLLGDGLKLVISKGYLSVDGFFMLSGFCISANYTKRIMTGSLRFSDFFKNHYAKFLSYSLITLPLALIKEWLVYRAGLDECPTILHTIMDLFCIRTGYGVSSTYPYNSPLWFMNVLLLVYVIYFAALKLSAKNDKDSVFTYRMVYIVLLIVGMIIQLHPEIRSIDRVDSLVTGVINFMLGCLLYEFVSAVDLTKSKAKMPVAVIAVVLLLSNLILFTSTGKVIFNEYRLSFMFTLWLPLILLLSLFQVAESSKNISFVYMLGRLSNSVFIWHHPILYILFALNFLTITSFNMESVWGLLAYLLVVIVVAFISSKWIETPVSKLLLCAMKDKKNVT